MKTLNNLFVIAENELLAKEEVSRSDGGKGSRSDGGTFGGGKD